MQIKISVFIQPQQFCYLEGIFNTWNSKARKMSKRQWVQHITVSNTLLCPYLILIYYIFPTSPCRLVRYFSAVRRLFFDLLESWDVRELYIRKTADLPLQRHISTFRGYRILFSIRNPYINRFTNHFSIHS